MDSYVSKGHKGSQFELGGSDSQPALLGRPQLDFLHFVPSKERYKAKNQQGPCCQRQMEPLASVHNMNQTKKLTAGGPTKQDCLQDY